MLQKCLKCQELARLGISLNGNKSRGNFFKRNVSWKTIKYTARFYFSVHASDWLYTPCPLQKTIDFFFGEGKTERSPVWGSSVTVECWVLYQTWENVSTCWMLNRKSSYWLLRWLNGKEPACQYRRHYETQVWSLDWEDPLEEEMATHSSILARRILWSEEPGGLQSIRSHRIRHDWVSEQVLLAQLTPNSQQSGLDLLGKMLEDPSLRITVHK